MQCKRGLEFCAKQTAREKYLKQQEQDIKSKKEVKDRGEGEGGREREIRTRYL